VGLSPAPGPALNVGLSPQGATPGVGAVPGKGLPSAWGCPQQRNYKTARNIYHQKCYKNRNEKIHHNKYNQRKKKYGEWKTYTFMPQIDKMK
jgi:hypothetical protein